MKKKEQVKTEKEIRNDLLKTRESSNEDSNIPDVSIRDWFYMKRLSKLALHFNNN